MTTGNEFRREGRMEVIMELEKWSNNFRNKHGENDLRVRDLDCLIEQMKEGRKVR